MQADQRDSGYAHLTHKALLWQEVTQRRHTKAALGVQSLSAWRLYRLRSVWATWADKAAESAAKHAVMQTTVTFWKSRALAKAFMQWQAEVARSHDLEALLASYVGELSVLWRSFCNAEISQ